MTVTEAAGAIGCSPRLVYRLCKEEAITFRRIGFGRGRIDITPGHVAEYLASVEHPANAGPIAPARQRLRGVVIPSAYRRMCQERAEREAAKGKSSHRA